MGKSQPHQVVKTHQLRSLSAPSSFCNCLHIVTLSAKEYLTDVFLPFFPHIVLLNLVWKLMTVR